MLLIFPGLSLPQSFEGDCAPAIAGGLVSTVLDPLNSSAHISSTGASLPSVTPPPPKVTFLPLKFYASVCVCVLCVRACMRSVAQSCQTLCDPMDCRLLGSSVHGQNSCPRQECWNGLLFPPPGNMPYLGIGPTSPALAGEFFITEPTGKLILYL